MIQLTNGLGQIFCVKAEEITVIRPTIPGEYGNNDKLISIVELGGKCYGCQESCLEIMRRLNDKV